MRTLIALVAMSLAFGCKNQEQETYEKRLAEMRGEQKAKEQFYKENEAKAKAAMQRTTDQIAKIGPASARLQERLAVAKTEQDTKAAYDEYWKATGMQPTR